MARWQKPSLAPDCQGMRIWPRGSLLGLGLGGVALVAIEGAAQVLLHWQVVLQNGQIERLLSGLDSLGGTAHLAIGLSQFGKEPRIFSVAQLNSLLKRGHGRGVVPVRCQGKSKIEAVLG